MSFDQQSQLMAPGRVGAGPRDGDGRGPQRELERPSGFFPRQLGQGCRCEPLVVGEPGQERRPRGVSSGDRVHDAERPCRPPCRGRAENVRGRTG